MTSDEESSYTKGFFATFCDTAYAPKGDNDVDNWDGGLNPDSHRLLELLGGDNVVYQQIRQAGQYLFRARELIKELEKSGKTKMDDIPQQTAEEILLNLTKFSQNPAMRWFISILAMHEVVSECYKLCAKENWPTDTKNWTDAQYNAVVTYCLSRQVNFSKSQDDDSMYQAIEAMKTCLKARPNEARMHVMLGNFYMVTGYATKANEHLERALELDEKNCFASH